MENWPQQLCALALVIGLAIVANTEIPVTTPILFGLEGLSCGYDAGAAVVPTYTSPFTFTGTIRKVTVDISTSLPAGPATG